jgi:hypothetical protein
MRNVYQAPWLQDQSQTLILVREMAINEIQMQKTEDYGVADLNRGSKSRTGQAFFRRRLCSNVTSMFSPLPVISLYLASDFRW